MISTAKVAPQGLAKRNKSIETLRIERECNLRREEFKTQAKQAGLITTSRPKDKSYWAFDLSSEEYIYLLEPTPDRLYQVIKLARQYDAYSSWSGTHNIILYSETSSNSLAQEDLYWMHLFQKMNKSITAKQFLEEKGFDLSDEALLAR